MSIKGFNPLNPHDTIGFCGSIMSRRLLSMAYGGTRCDQVVKRITRNAIFGLPGVQGSWPKSPAEATAVLGFSSVFAAASDVDVDLNIASGNPTVFYGNAFPAGANPAYGRSGPYGTPLRDNDKATSTATAGGTAFAMASGTTLDVTTGDLIICWLAKIQEGLPDTGTPSTTTLFVNKMTGSTGYSLEVPGAIGGTSGSPPPIIFSIGVGLLLQVRADAHVGQWHVGIAIRKGANIYIATKALGGNVSSASGPGTTSSITSSGFPFESKGTGRLNLSKLLIGTNTNAAGTVATNILTAIEALRAYVVNERFGADLATFPDAIAPKRGLLTRLQQSFAGDLQPPTIPFPDLSWQPEYPEYVRRKPAATALLLAAMVAPTLAIPDPVTYVPVEFPDSVPRRTMPTADQRSFFTPEIQPTYQPLGWNVSYPDRIPPRRGLSTQQQQSFVEPVQLPTYAALGWDVVFPDRVDPKRGLPTAGQLAYVAPDQLPTYEPLGWSADFPDRLAAARFLPSNQRAYFAPELAVVAAIPDVSWIAQYPDFARKLTLATAQHAFFVAPVRQPDPPEHSWSGIFPDRVEPKRGLNITQQRAAFAPEQLPTYQDLGWSNVFPDRINRRTLHVSQQKHSVVPEQLPTHQPLGWNVAYADRVEAKRSLPTVQQLAWSAPQRQPDPPERSWRAVYPDRISPRVSLPVVEQRAWFAPDQQPTYQPLGWGTAYPDRLSAARFLTVEQRAYFAPDYLEVVVQADVSWMARYPDTTRRITFAVAQQRASFAPEQLPTYQPLGWTQTSFPDRVTKPTFGVTLQKHFTSPEQLPTYQPLGWYGVFPERVTRPTFNITLQRHFVLPERQPDIIVPALSWLAVYPSYLRRQAMLVVSNQKHFVIPAALPTYQPLGWYGVFPERVLPKRGLLVAQQRHVTAPDRQPEPPAHAWAGVYPDRLYRFTLRTASQQHTAPPDRQPDPPTRSWSSIYPDRLVKPTYPTVEQSAFVAPVRQPEPPALAWLSGYPDKLYRPTFATSEQLAWIAPDRQPDPPTLSWLGVYVDRITRFKFLVDLQQSFVGSLAPVVPLPPLTWQPVYPVAISRWAPRTHFSPTFWHPEGLIPNVSAGRLCAVLTADGLTGAISVDSLSATVTSTTLSGDVEVDQSSGSLTDGGSLRGTFEDDDC